MARIISISYDEALLFTRELMLRDRGHTVVSALGFVHALTACDRPNNDLLVVGHSIPKADKLKIIGCFRKANPGALVIALIRANEERLSEVDAYVYPGNPEDLLRAIDSLVHPAVDRRASARTTRMP